jgi:hypothetical protein
MSSETANNVHTHYTHFPKPKSCSVGLLMPENLEKPGKPGKPTRQSQQTNKQ